MFSKIKYAVFAISLVVASGCKDLLQTEPRQSVSAESALADITGIRALMISCYDGLQGAGYYGQRMMIGPDILADNVRLTNSNSNRYFQDRVNTPGTGQNLWGLYGTINRINFVLAGIDNANTTPAEKSQLKGEALFLRALLYHDMVRSHAYEPTKVVNGFNLGVIIRDQPTADVAQADFRTRATVAEVYQFIERDLQQAITLLAPNTSRLRATRGAAQALLARVYLYWERWNDAIRLSTDAMNGTPAVLITATGYANAWRSAPNPESLFEINYVQATESLGSNESMQSLTTLVTGSWGDVVPTNEVLGLFEPTDVRRALIIPGVKGGEPVQFVQKYTGARGPWTDNIAVIRFSELMLIRAEAYAETNQIALAIADLNRLRSNRGASPVAAATREEAVELILRERRMELLLEGHRWYDLKRKGRDITKAGLSAIVPYTDFRILAPIPVTEVQLNNLLRQNPGY